MKTPRLAAIVITFITIQAVAQNTITQPTPQSITGSVLAVDGTPATGATVVVTRSTSPEPFIREVARTVADSGGKFSVAVPATQPDDRQPDAPTAFAYLPGVGISQSSPLGSSSIELRLSARGDVHLSYVDSTGKPVAGVKVHPSMIVFPGNRGGGLIPFGSFVQLPASVANELAATTDANGQCTIIGLPRKSQVRLETDDSSFAQDQMSMESRVTLADQSVTTGGPIHLISSASIVGQVINPETGKPERGIAVEAEPPSTYDGGPRGSARAVSDAQGHFELDRLPPGRYYVELDSAGQSVKTWAAVPLPVELTEGLQSNADLHLTRGGLVTGQLRFADTHKPVVGMDIGIYFGSDSAHWINLQSAKSDADGRYSFRVPAGKHYLYIADQAGPDGYRLPTDAPSFPVVVEGQTTTTDFEFPVDDIPAIAGTVNDPDGKPVSGATVLCDNPETGRSMEITKVAQTDASGTFRIPGGKPGAILRARFDKSATLQAYTVQNPGDQVTLELSDSAIFNMDVTVADAAGYPVPGASIQLFVQAGQFGRGQSTPSPDPQGKAIIDSLFTDTQYSIWAQAPGYGVTQSRKLNHADSSPLPIKLVLKKATSVISGTVTDELGTPLANMQVTMNGSATGVQSTMSDAQGKFSFAVVDGARANFTFRGPEGHEASFVSAKAGDTDVQLVTHHPQTQPSAN